MTGEAIVSSSILKTTQFSIFRITVLLIPFNTQWMLSISETYLLNEHLVKSQTIRALKLVRQGPPTTCLKITKVRNPRNPIKQTHHPMLSNFIRGTICGVETKCSHLRSQWVDIHIIQLTLETFTKRTRISKIARQPAEPANQYHNFGEHSQQ